MPILQTMDPYERTTLGDALVQETFKKDEVIIKEGERGDKFYLIMDGTAIATKQINNQEIKVMDYTNGGYFGERALLLNDMRAASIIATSDCVAVTLERETFIRLLGPLDELLKRNMTVYSKFQ